jgi:uridine kinase
MKDDKSLFLIGITGGSGSGKTTFINKLRSVFTEEELCVLSQDNYYRPRQDQLIDDQGVKNFDRLDSIDMWQFEKDTELLVSGQEVVRTEYVFNNENAEPQKLVFKPAPVVIIEGLFVMASDVMRHLMDMRVYIFAHEIKKVIRRIRRDGLERNYPIDDVLYRYEHHVMPSYEKYIKPTLFEADVIINNNNDMESALLLYEGFIRNYVNEYRAAHAK